jgi:hypothetical protein
MEGHGKLQEKRRHIVALRKPGNSDDFLGD